MSKGRTRLRRFIAEILGRTPFLKMVALLATLWLIFSAAFYLAESQNEHTTITSYGRALYWGIAAFSTAGIADTPLTGLSLVVGGLWIITGSILFFGIIVATVTSYFMRPLQRPAKQIINTIEYNLEQMDDLSIDELDLLKETVDALIVHMERLKASSQSEQAENKPSIGAQ